MWNVLIDGQNAPVPLAALEVMPVRYLGVYLGGPRAVQRHWNESVAGKVTARRKRIQLAGVPATCYGRTTAIKTHAFASVIYHVTNQAPG